MEAPLADGRGRRNPRTIGLLRVVTLLAGVATLNGCAVAVYRISAPERLPPNSLPPLTRPITFDVCLDRHGSSLPAFEAERTKIADQYRSALAKAGVTASLDSSAGAPVQFTLTPGWQSEGDVSWALSFLTFSIVPGYGVERRTMDVEMAPADARRREHRHYQTRKKMFMWLPLIVYPDLVGTMDGGWESFKKEEAAFDQMVGRLGDDLRARWGGDGGMPAVRMTDGVVCSPPAP